MKSYQRFARIFFDFKPNFESYKNELIFRFIIISFCFANKKFHELSFTEFDIPVELTPTVYPVCLPEISLDPELLAGEFCI